MKGVQCYELFGGIALKNHTFSFFIFITKQRYLGFTVLAVSGLMTRGLNIACSLFDCSSIAIDPS